MNIEYTVEQLQEMEPSEAMAVCRDINARCKMELAELRVRFEAGAEEDKAFYFEVVEHILGEIGKNPAGAHAVRALNAQGESAVTYLALLQAALDKRFAPGLPEVELSTVSLEFQLKVGRADIVAFNSDGSATVIEVKNGIHGWRSVVAGIGQAGFYAAQLGLKGVASRIDRALAWSSTGEDDKLIEAACISAGVFPIKLQSVKDFRERLIEEVCSEANVRLARYYDAAMAAISPEDRALIEQLSARCGVNDSEAKISGRGLLV